MAVRSGLLKTVAMPPTELLEISDLIVDFDVETLRRRPVAKSAVVDRLRHYLRRREFRRKMGR
jgi:hypothetical protein